MQMWPEVELELPRCFCILGSPQGALQGLRHLWGGALTGNHLPSSLRGHSRGASQPHPRSPLAAPPAQSLVPQAISWMLDFHGAVGKEGPGNLPLSSPWVSIRVPLFLTFPWSHQKLSSQSLY